MVHEKWETVNEEIDGHTERMVVPGGWIYRVTMLGIVQMCFVPNPNGMMRARADD